MTELVTGTGEPAPAPAATQPGAEPSVARVSQWADIRHRFFANKLAVVGLAIIVVLVLTALLAPVLAPYDPLKQDLTATLQAPGGKHLLGTDALGRDQLSRLIYGSRIAVVVGLASILVALTIGIVLGALAGYFGRWVDTVIMRAADIFFAFPLLIGSIVIILLMGRGVLPVVLSLGIFQWATFARLLRSQILSVREMDFVHAARALGAGRSRIIRKHILPNSVTSVLVYGTSNVGIAIVAEASLSYLGVGVDPEVAEWGNMISAGRGFMGVKDFMWTYPSLAIVITALGFILLGNGLRDALDPKLR
ncbi:ABC transporter permease [Streptomyces echinoruber]|jgi:peptide/nickel transport system permease protein|uniref:Peptide ABC transporter permease n=1 Tax=Streptomyces echinoruber TaxID=68898 RepID=A0A918V8A5_9ACTN|nr:ABC transporter permease [Streptomyces echinoruber]GGZ74995.1 peptide ABC transporter permease [Streptomyces echinoruber]